MGRGEGEEEGTEGQTHYVVEQFVAEVRRVKIIKKKNKFVKNMRCHVHVRKCVWVFKILSFMQQGRFANVAKTQR